MSYNIRGLVFSSSAQCFALGTVFREGRRKSKNSSSGTRFDATLGYPGEGPRFTCPICWLDLDLPCVPTCFNEHMTCPSCYIQQISPACALCRGEEVSGMVPALRLSLSAGDFMGVLITCAAICRHWCLPEDVVENLLNRMMREFDSTLGYPGEGPPKAQKRRARGKRELAIADQLADQEAKIAARPDTPPPPPALKATHLIVEAFGPEGSVGCVVAGEHCRVVWAGEDKAAINDQGTVYSRGNGYTICQEDGKIREAMTTLSIGHYTSAINKNEYNFDACVTPIAPYQRHFVPTIEIADKKYPARDHWVFQEGLLSLQSNMTGMSLSALNINACVAQLFKKFPGIPAAYKMSTVVYFVYTARMAKIVPLREAGISPAPGHDHGQPIEYITAVHGALLGTVFSAARILRMPATKGIHFPPVEDNGKFQLGRSKGFNGPLTNGSFLSSGAGDPPRWYQSILLRIFGDRDFLIHEKDGNTASYALQRMYKARPYEAALQNNQLALSHVILRNPRLHLVMRNPRMPQPIPVDVLHHQEYLARQWHLNSMTIWTSKVSHLWSTAPMWLAYCTFASLARRDYVAAPRPKRQLYQAWWEMYKLREGHHYHVRLDSTHVEAHVKREFAKPGKVGRLYVSYGPSILYGGFIFDTIKDLFCQKYPSTLPGFKLTVDIRKKLTYDLSGYADLEHHTGIARAYSDDMSVMLNWHGTPILFDIDISCCDASQGPSIFLLLAELLEQAGCGFLVEGLLARLMEPITLRNPSNPREFVELTHDEVYEGSGCPETTCANHIASFCILTVLGSLLNEVSHRTANELQRILPQVIERAGSIVGHAVTYKIVDREEQLTFLKHSLLDCTWTLNYGTIFRSLGSVEQDLTHTQLNLKPHAFSLLSVEEKTERFVSSVVAGLVHEPQSVVMDALRARFSAPVAPRFGGFWISLFNATLPSWLWTHTRRHLRVSTTALINRYGGEPSEWASLAEAIAETSTYQFRYHPLVTAIMAVDYGL